jgi:hypothetical protein
VQAVQRKSQSESPAESHRRGSSFRLRILRSLDFEFDAERAEWMRWYMELQQSTGDTMLGTGSSADFFLYNWSVCFVPPISE